jgi:multidrug efflux pump subunit AcrA (membrane-fusion protein)
LIRIASIILAILGLAVGVFAVATAKPKETPQPLARPASVNPYERGVAALGLVEPAGRSVAIVAPEAAMVVRVHVDVNDQVAEKQPLFELDTRPLEAEIVRAQAAVVAAQADIDRWHALPRQETLPPLRAAVERARAVLADREELLRLADDSQRRGANTTRDVSAARYARDSAKAELDGALADLASAEAGGWRPDLAIASATLDQRKAAVQALELLKERLIVRAPRAGKVLRRQIETGEFATTDAARPALILGDLSRLHVRAQVDEEDIALVRTNARAIARTRGSVQRELALRLVRVEPFARPKTDLIGVNSERVDTRVIDVVFEVPESDGADREATLYPGQAVDVFIEAR